MKDALLSNLLSGSSNNENLEKDFFICELDKSEWLCIEDFRIWHNKEFPRSKFTQFDIDGALYGVPTSNRQYTINLSIARKDPSKYLQVEPIKLINFAFFMRENGWQFNKEMVFEEKDTPPVVFNYIEYPTYHAELSMVLSYLNEKGISRDDLFKTFYPDMDRNRYNIRVAVDLTNVSSNDYIYRFLYQYDEMVSFFAKLGVSVKRYFSFIKK